MALRTKTTCCEYHANGGKYGNCCSAESSASSGTAPKCSNCGNPVNDTFTECTQYGHCVSVDDKQRQYASEAAVSASPAAPPDRASAAAGEAFVKFKNGEKPPTWLEVGEWLNKFELWPVVASPAAPQPDCNCGAGNDAYPVRHSDKCALKIWAAPKCPHCGKSSLESRVASPAASTTQIANKWIEKWLLGAYTPRQCVENAIAEVLRESGEGSKS